ncbi:MAG: nuclear transport factor 2 family protein [Nonomuraea sp.]|nr:nuclear transport factor 2 family protein [Nonomuraea sp.]NUP77210.1 nuclear transport factor 2 family protein [Nonomuraea sp.]
MSDFEKELLGLEQQMLDADAAYDEAFFEEHCADDFMALGSYGIVSRQQVLDMYTNGSGNPDRHNRVNDAVVKPLGDDGAVVAYTLTSTTGEETAQWYATTVYRRTPEGWRVVVLHQTPR